MGRAGHGVPVAQQPAHGEHQGIGVAGGFGQAQGRISPEACLARRGREGQIDIEARCAVAGGSAGGEGPLLGAVLGQEPVAEAATVAEPAGRERHEFGIHLRCGGVAELIDKTEAPAQLRKDRPVGPGLAGGLAEGRAEGDAALGVHHYASLLAPLGRRQHQVGQGLGFRAGIGLAQHHQRAVRHRRPHPIEAGQAY